MLINLYKKLRTSPIRLLIFLFTLILMPTVIVVIVIFKHETSYMMLSLYVLISIINIFMIASYERRSIYSENEDYKFSDLTKRIIRSSILVDILLLYYLFSR